MSLSRPARFPLLKLPWLCIESVIKNWDIFDIIFFALSSKRTRQIVKHLKIPLNGIRINLSDRTRIELDNFSREWHFWNESEKESFFDGRQNLKKNPLVLQKNAVPLYTSKTDVILESYSSGHEFIALKMAMEFLNEVFKCSIEEVNIIGDNFPESGNIGVKSTVNLWINRDSRQPFGYAQSQKLSLLLENLEVTGTCELWTRDPEQGFYADPKLFKCKKVEFCFSSGAWVTKEVLMHFEIPQLMFSDCSFSVEDVLVVVTYWFHSDNKKLEYLYVEFRTRQVSLDEFQTSELNPVPFSERNRVSLIFFAVISKKTRQIVKHLKIPLNRIAIYLSNQKCIELRDLFRKWHFRNDREPKSFFEEYKYMKKNPLVLRKNAIPLYTIRKNVSLESFCEDNEITASKMAMEFLNEVFKCSVETVYIDRDSFPESGDVGVETTVNLTIDLNFHKAQDQKLSLLLGNLEVTGRCALWMAITEKDFYVDPKLFKCRELEFFPGSAAWVTREILLQFEVPQLKFEHCPFSVEDIMFFVTHWFHSDNKKLEYLFILLQGKQISLEEFQTKELNFIPFNGRIHVPPSGYFRYIDFSEGLEIIRHDGLAATIHNILRSDFHESSSNREKFKPRLESSFDHNSRKTFLMLQNNPIPLYTSINDDSLISYTFGNGVAVLKMVMEFLNEVFKCSVEMLYIEEGDFLESFGLKSTVNLAFRYRNLQPFGYAQSQKLSLLLENLEVTGACDFSMKNTERDFYVDPKLFKCRKLMFGTGSAAWVTREILLQFEVPQLMFSDCPFSVEDILAFFTHWFHSDNKKLEYLCIVFRSRQYSLETFRREELNPVSFSGSTRIPLSDPFGFIDFSKGLEVVRHDGLSATIHVNDGRFLFYIWHNQSAVTQS